MDGRTSFPPPYILSASGACDAEVVAGFAADGSPVWARRRPSGWEKVSPREGMKLMSQLGLRRVDDVFVARVFFIKALADIAEGAAASVAAPAARSDDSPNPETPGYGVW